MGLPTRGGGGLAGFDDASWRSHLDVSYLLYRDCKIPLVLLLWFFPFALFSVFNRPGARFMYVTRPRRPRAARRASVARGAIRVRSSSPHLDLAGNEPLDRGRGAQMVSQQS